MANETLSRAKREKNDEFYTQYRDIEREVQAYIDYDPGLFRDKTILLPCDDPEWSEFTRYFAQRFDELGIKKLISTGYAPDSKTCRAPMQPTLFETASPLYNPEKSRTRGRIFVLDRDKNRDGRIDLDDLEWRYLEGDGDFRSPEVCRLRDEADFIITNPPFSLFREFLSWMVEADKRFLVIGNKNAITYKEVFPLIKENRMWMGRGFESGNAFFRIPDDGSKYVEGVYDTETKLVKFRNCNWFTNVDHARRHEELKLMTIEENLRYSKHKEIKGKSFEEAYPRYDNYDAIEVAYTDAIPDDYYGVMGVPISFLDKYCPEQFEIVEFRKGADGKDLVYSVRSHTHTHTHRSAFSLTSEYSSVDVDRWIDEQSERYGSEWEEQVRQNSYPATAIPGMIKNAEGKIGDRITYARITIRRVR